MTATVVFDAATLADALERAERVAPKRGHALLTSAGILLEVSAGRVTVRSTDTEVFYTSSIPSISQAGESTWRVSHKLIVPFVRALVRKQPVTVTLRDHPTGRLTLDSPRAKATIPLMSTHSYPLWEPYPGENASPVPGLGMAISMVSWACDPQADPFTGICLDGQHVMAANRARAAMVDCPIPVIGDKPITVPAKMLGSILRDAADPHASILPTFLGLAPDPDTQIRCRVFGQGLPSLRGFTAIDYAHHVEVPKDELVSSIASMVGMTGGAKAPNVKIMLGGGAMTLRIDDETGDGSISQSIELPDADHAPVLLAFDPKVFSDGVSRCPGRAVTLSYNPAGTPKAHIVRADGGNGYRAWFAQRALTRS